MLRAARLGLRRGIIEGQVLLDRLRDSFLPEDARAEALRDRACSAVERLHGVLGRASYTFHLAEIRDGAEGKHDQNNYIVVNSRARFPVLTAIHEFGHALDAVFLNSAQLGVSPDDPPWDYATDMAQAAEGTAGQGATLLCDWLACVRGSTHHVRLIGALAEPSITRAQTDQISKLLKPRELWARSYELFIATRCSDRELRGNMEAERKDSAHIGSTVVYNYWQAGDFDAVADSIEQAFRRLGWLAT